MEHNISETSNGKKILNKAKSQSSGQAKKAAREPAKPKSFNLNEADKSMDMALGRLKKSKLVNGEPSTAHTVPGRVTTDDMFMDTSPSVNMTNVDNTSLISMNFSHYELMRNISQPNCNYEDSFSNTNSDIFSSLTDMTLRDEQLERYFRSAELWRNWGEDDPSSLQDEVCEK